MIWRSLHVEFREHQVGLQRSRFSLYAGEPKHPFEKLLRILPMVGALSPITNHVRIGLLMQHALPDFQIPRHMRIAIGFPLETCEKQKKTWIRTEYRSCRLGVGTLPAERLITVS